MQLKKEQLKNIKGGSFLGRMGEDFNYGYHKGSKVHSILQHAGESYEFLKHFI